MFRACLSGCVAIILVTAANADDAKELRGTWTVAEGVTAGEKLPAYSAPRVSDR